MTKNIIKISRVSGPLIQNIIKISRISGNYNLDVRDKLIRLVGEQSLTSLLNNVGWKLIVLILQSNKKATSRIRLMHRLYTYCAYLTKHHGIEFTVAYLKLSGLALSKFLAGEPVKSLRDLDPTLPLPRLRKCGLPKYISVDHA